MFLKRIFDLILSIFGLIVFSPVLMIAALFIVVDSRGPIFYRGLRTGYKGRAFKIFKLRTMFNNSDIEGRYSTAQNDPRVTRIGGILRRFKIDELPQLINVLIGEMSIVGPRPEVLAYTSLYTEEEKEIFSVKPGITDYSSTEFVQLGTLLGNQEPDRKYEQIIMPVKNKLRIRYVRESNLIVDIKIIVKTIKSILKA
jgi:lipopolysaccharide/colanic/teichoic acid biosynthesis glycosyltransferase